MKVTILGAGAWGTAIASQAARQQGTADVCLWSRDADQLLEIEKTGENKAYLPGIPLPRSIKLEKDFANAVQRLSSDDLLVIATPMSGLSETVKNVLKLKLSAICVFILFINSLLFW